MPLLIIAPTINKYYVVDVAPGRSLIEYLLQQGQQVFVMSWRYPDARHSKWGFDAYDEAMIDAYDAVDQITGPRGGHPLLRPSGVAVCDRGGA